jgi:hypothetical protein
MLEAEGKPLMHNSPSSLRRIGLLLLGLIMLLGLAWASFSPALAQPAALGAGQQAAATVTPTVIAPGTPSENNTLGPIIMAGLAGLVVVVGVLWARRRHKGIKPAS